MSYLEMIARPFIDKLFPKVCRHCGDPFQTGLSNILCLDCVDLVVPPPDPVCSHCGVGLAPRAFEGSASPRCRDCGEDAYHLEETRAFGRYEGPVRIAHHAFKFEGMASLGKDIASRMFRAAPDRFWERGGVLTPVPLSPERERERGYNPSGVLSKEVSARTGLPHLPLLRKVRPTVPQMSLRREDRRRNPAGAYALEPHRTVPARVILVDDVYTTGATLEECAKVLRRSGVRAVAALVFGRTPHK